MCEALQALLPTAALDGFHIILVFLTYFHPHAAVSQLIFIIMSVLAEGKKTVKAFFIFEALSQMM